MPEELDTILRLVAEGTLSPDEAAPIIEALTRAERARAGDEPSDLGARRVPPADGPIPASGGRRQLRIRVTERGRQVVNLRIPIGFVDTALRFVPGLGGEQAASIRDAVRAGAVGPIIDVEDGDESVLISVE